MRKYLALARLSVIMNEARVRKPSVARSDAAGRTSYTTARRPPGTCAGLYSTAAVDARL